MSLPFDNPIHFRKSDADTTLYFVRTNLPNQFISAAYRNEYEAWSADTLYLDYETTDVPAQSQAGPVNFELFQNFPNPFNPVTSIHYSISQKSYMELAVFNCLGEIIEILVNATKQPGDYNVTFDASTRPSGIYYYRLRSGEFSETRKMLFIK